MKINIIKLHLSKVPEPPKKIVPEKKVPAVTPKKETVPPPKGILDFTLFLKMLLFPFFLSQCLLWMLITAISKCVFTHHIFSVFLSYVWLCYLLSFKCQKSQRNQFQRKRFPPKWLRKKNLLQSKVNRILQPKACRHLSCLFVSLAAVLWVSLSGCRLLVYVGGTGVVAPCLWVELKLLVVMFSCMYCKFFDSTSIILSGWYILLQFSSKLYNPLILKLSLKWLRGTCKLPRKRKLLL